MTALSVLRSLVISGRSNDDVATDTPPRGLDAIEADQRELTALTERVQKNLDEARATLQSAKVARPPLLGAADRGEETARERLDANTQQQTLLGAHIEDHDVELQELARDLRYAHREESAAA